MSAATLAALVVLVGGLVVLVSTMARIWAATPRSRRRPR